jgi:hypothetical protein
MLVVLQSGNFAGASKVWETMRDKAIVPDAGACASVCCSLSVVVLLLLLSRLSEMWACSGWRL